MSQHFALICGCLGRSDSSTKQLKPRFEPPSLPGGHAFVSELKEQLGGRLWLPADGEAYDQARGVLGAPGVKIRPGDRTPTDPSQGSRVTYNQDAIGRPAAIAGCSCVEDVQRVVQYAAKHCGGDTGVWLGVAGGRHSHQCMVDGMFVCDLSRLDLVEVDPVNKLAHVQGGAQLGQLDAACLPHKLATTAGHNATTGVGGLTIQGGHGYLERTFGLVVDNLVGFDIVLASGELKTCSKDVNADLFWAVRGGGGNFGIVTMFVIQLYDFPEKIPVGTRVHLPLGYLGLPGRSSLLQGWYKMVDAAPREASSVLVMSAGGPVIEVLVWVAPPVLEKDDGGMEINTGRANEESVKNGKVFWEEHSQGKFRLENSWAQKCYWTEVQQMVPAGTAHMYQSGLMLKERLPPEACDKLANFLLATNAPTKQCMVIQALLGGRAADEELRSSSSNSFRDAMFWLLIMGEWVPTQDAAKDADTRAKVVTWVRDLKDSLAPYTAGHYAVLSDAANGIASDVGSTADALIMENLGAFACQNQHRNIYGENLPRLQKLKAQYDPSNMFRLNDNIKV